jgi:hypothetical protein
MKCAVKAIFARIIDAQLTFARIIAEELSHAYLVGPKSFNAQ